jgi:hypothetical protein
LKRLHRLEDQLQQERQQSQLLNPQVDWLDGVPPGIPSGNLSQRSSASELNAVSSTESFNFSEFSAQSPSMTVADDPSSDGNSSRRQPSIQSLRLADTHKGHTQVAHAHSVWLWPATLDVLKACSSPVLDALYSLQFNEISWLMRLQKPGWDENSFDGGTATHPPATGDKGGLMNRFNYWIALSFEEIQKLSNVYFNTFNHLYPFMDRGGFFSNTLPKAMDGPRQAEDETTITLLILALGQLAQEGSTGTPIFQSGLRSSGIRGGNADLPPGFSLFDKARQRIGFAVTQYSLEAVQIFSLVGLVFSFPFN